MKIEHASEEPAIAGSTATRRSPPSLQIFAGVLAILGWFSLVAQCGLSIRFQMERGHTAAYGLFMYAGYFTILTNLLCALVATAYLRPRSPASRWFALREPWVVTAAAVSIVMVGAIFHVLLRSQYQPTGLSALTNLIHHYVVPAGFLVFWWLAVPRGSLVWGDIWRVFAYPTAYLVYVLMRGEVSGVYPYFFVDVPVIGYARAIANSAGIAMVFVAVGAVFVAAKR
jgi:hypothetical protein